MLNSNKSIMQINELPYAYRTWKITPRAPVRNKIKNKKKQQQQQLYKKYGGAERASLKKKIRS